MSVAFTTPGANGSPITSYTVTAAPGGASRTCSASPCVVTGLTNGTDYTFTVVATNDVGNSAPSAVSGKVAPAAGAGAPSLQSATSVAGAAVLKFTRPERDGGMVISGYEVSVDGGHSWRPLTVSGTVTLSATVTGLTNGATYPVSVRAVTAVGGGKASNVLSVTPATVPGAPRTVHATSTGPTVTVAWTAPVSDGGSAITRYLVTARPGGQTCTTTTTSCVFGHLVAGVTYTFRVVAVNTTAARTGTGTGPAGLSAAVRVSTVPGVPRTLVVHPGDRVLGVSFQAPSDNGGSAITFYQVSLDRGRTWHRLATTGGTTLHATVAPVLNGATYPLAIRAVNSNGAGPATPGVTVRTVAWFHDPLTKAQRAKEVNIPKDPARYRGPIRHTTASSRSHNGTLAVPVAGLLGRQLQPGQAVDLGASLFAFDSGQLTKQGQAQVKKLTISLKYVTALTCEGYADYAGKATHELTLSQQRAQTVCTLINTYAKHITRNTLAYGRSWPAVIGGRAIDRAANRRVVVLIR